MPVTRRNVGLILLGAGASILVGPLVRRLFAQDQAPPNRREFTIGAWLTPSPSTKRPGCASASVAAPLTAEVGGLR